MTLKILIRGAEVEKKVSTNMEQYMVNVVQYTLKQSCL